MKILLNKQTNKIILPSKITEDLLKEAKEFFKFTKTLDNCAGLAYNQCGGNKRFCSIFRDEIIYMINPVIEIAKGKATLKEEGCLSFPGKITIEYRFPSVIVSYYDFYKEKKISKQFLNFTAQVIQHEIDHLNGGVHIFKEQTNAKD